ncbi:MAG: N-acetylneuraminate synthase family protein, partial [Bacteroidota bacterium]
NDLTILQCTTSYPTPPERVGLNVIGEFKARYPDVKIGLSEHTSKIYTGLAAVALGVEVLEFHAVFDRRMFGPDASSSLEINEIRELVEGVRFIEKMTANPINKSDNTEYTGLKKIFEKTLAINKDLKSGSILKFEDLETKKPAKMGIAASDFKSVIGKKLLVDKKRYDFLQKEDISL